MRFDAYLLEALVLYYVLSFEMTWCQNYLNIFVI
jgi:hypothetical protein